MNNDPLVTDQEIYEYACSYLNTTTPLSAAERTGQTVRLIYETELDTLRGETSDMIAKLYAQRHTSDHDSELHKLRTENARLTAERDELRQLLAQAQQAAASDRNQRRRAMVALGRQQASVHTLSQRVQALETEAEQHRGDHK